MQFCVDTYYILSRDANQSSGKNFAFLILPPPPSSPDSLPPVANATKGPIMFTRARSTESGKKGDDGRPSAMGLRYFWKSKRLEIASWPRWRARDSPFQGSLARETQL